MGLSSKFVTGIAALMLLASGGTAAVAESTCGNSWPSYWQDPDPKFSAMWSGQIVSNAPPAGWSGPVFRLSDRYPTEYIDETADQPWRHASFDAMFDPKTERATKEKLAREYLWAVMRYLQEGNVEGKDVNKHWTLCDNPVRSWYHIPFQTYDVLSGREFVHGLTREASVTFNLKVPDHPNTNASLKATMWAAAMYNPTAAVTLGQVWKRDGTVVTPTTGLNFREGSFIGKPLFITLTPDQFPILSNMPTWTANISDPSFCVCKLQNGKGCSMVEQSRQCPRSTVLWQKVRLLQFDVAVKDHRARATGWVYGTMVADGERRAYESNPWNRMSELGLMWGIDAPPAGVTAAQFPQNPRRDGFAEQVIFWDTVDMLDGLAGDIRSQSPAHLGCNSRLNGPADNGLSACMSCHMTASVPDRNLATPPIVAQFGGITGQCVTPSSTDPNNGTDNKGKSAKVMGGITFAEMDGIYFANTMGGKPVNMTVKRTGGSVNVLGNRPDYQDGRKEWISVDFALQMSSALISWGEWQQHLAEQAKPSPRVFQGRRPLR